MIKEITKKVEPLLFQDITEFSIDSEQDYRRASSFYRADIIEFKKEDAQYFEDIENFEQYIGTWKTNMWVFDPEHGSDDEIREIYRVEKKEEMIKKVTWQKI